MKDQATAGQYALLSPGLHAGFKGRYNEKATPKGGANPQKRPQLGSTVGTHGREYGMPSKRVSLKRVEYVPVLCTHRPSLHIRYVRNEIIHISHYIGAEES